MAPLVEAAQVGFARKAASLVDELHAFSPRGGVDNPARPRRQRPVNPHAAANALTLQHQDTAERVAANIARRSGHPKEDLHQIAMLGILQAARRFSPERGSFRPYARTDACTDANGDGYHYLRDKGFLIKVPANWRELHARGLKLMRLGMAAAEVPGRLGVSAERWREIVQACAQRVVAWDVECSEAERWLVAAAQTADLFSPRAHHQG